LIFVTNYVFNNHDDSGFAIRRQLRNISRLPANLLWHHWMFHLSWLWQCYTGWYSWHSVQHLQSVLNAVHSIFIVQDDIISLLILLLFGSNLYSQAMLLYSSAYNHEHHHSTPSSTYLSLLVSFLIKLFSPHSPQKI